MHHTGISTSSVSEKYSDLIYSTCLGLLSTLFSLITFRVPNMENAYSDLREIPLLIGVVHLRNPLYVLLMCLLSPISYGLSELYIPTLVMHVPPVLLFWWYYQKLNTRQLDNIRLGAIWFVLTLVYYYVLIYPCFILSYNFFGLTKDPFMVTYKYLVTSGIYEIVATSLTTTLYVVQHSIRESLMFTNQNQEHLIQERTTELTIANKELQALNEELTATNEEVKSLNDNLEKMVTARTNEIKEQLTKLSKYAYMNAHEVRGPLARILGLIILIRHESDPALFKEIIQKLETSSEELDSIITSMNRLLENEGNNTSIE